LRFHHVTLGCAFCAVLALAACGPSGPSGPPAPEVGVVIIRPQQATLTTDLPGRTTPYAVSDVRPQVSGILKARLFTEGSVVRAGQPLYQIDPAPYQAAYDNAKAVLAGAEAAETTAKLKADRYTALQKQSAIAPQDYNDAVAAYKQAVATVQQDKALLETARINLGYTRIIAPITGRIGASSVTQGALVTADQTTALATIQTLDPIYVDINQSSSELLALENEVSEGQISRKGPLSARVTLQLDDGRAYPLDGTLQFSDVTVDPTTGAVLLRAIFPNPSGVLLPGMYVRATVVEGVNPKAILAPQQAVSRNEKGQPTAIIVDKNGIARLRVLTVARVVGANWLVTSGLAPGDRVVTEGLLKARPDQPVHAVPAGSPSSGP
jgi:membrane fusion protein (multidrug efflux system)